MEHRPGTASRRRLEDEFYRVLGKFNNRQWNEFARSKRNGLNLPEYQIDDIRSDYSSDVREQKYQMLSLWQRRNGKKASAELLERLVNNFLNPDQLQHDSSISSNPEPVTHDIGCRLASDSSDPGVGRRVGSSSSALNVGRRLGNDSSDAAREPIPQHSLPVISNPDPSPSLNHESVNVHSIQSTDRTFDVAPNGIATAQRENPPRNRNGHHSLVSRNIHGDGNISGRAYHSVPQPSNANYSNHSTAIYQGDMSDATGYRGPITHPKALASPPRVSTSRSHSSTSHKVPFQNFALPNPLAGLGNVNINVIGENAIGVQTNYYFGGRKVQKKSQPKETSKELAEYCSKVSKVEVVSSTADFYEEHLEKLELTYKVTHKQKGTVLIINNSFPSQPDERHGSDRDVKNLTELWEKMGCKVYLKKEPTASESVAALEKFAGMRASYNSDFVVVIIMSHGEQKGGKDVFYGADRKTVEVQDVLSIFNNLNAKRLQGIPKLFFFQFCRGDAVDMGTETPSRTESQGDESLFNSLGNTVSQTTGLYRGGDSTDAQGIPTSRRPTVSDTIISFATQPGFRAFRNNEGGSWYINAIVNIFMRYAHDQHLLDLMTMVNKAVSSKTAINESDATVHEGKEMSDFRSMLRKKLYFFPGFPEDIKDDDDDRL